MSKVLVVDDDDHVRRALAIILKHHGFEVSLAPDGEDCLRQLRAGFSGVVLMDIMMPGLSGWETIRRIISENLFQGILICMLTARASPGSEGEEFDEYIFDYLPKPFETSVLLHFVRSALRVLEA